MLHLVQKKRTILKGKTTAYLPDKDKSIWLHLPTMCSFKQNICPILDQVLTSFLTGRKLHLVSSPPQNVLPTQKLPETI